MPKNYFPKSKPNTRIKLALNWLPDNIDSLFDAGCSHGYGSFFFKAKSNHVTAMDIDEHSIAHAKENYPDINFLVGALEDTAIPSESFDYIICLDVLEHTNDKIKTLSEMHRILKPGGTIVLATPHRGLFSLLDPYNFGYYLRTKAFPIYKFSYSAVHLIKRGKLPKTFNPMHLEKHYHYSLNDLKSMLDESSFNDNYVIEKKFSSGLFFYPLSLILEALSNIIFPQKVSNVIIKPFTMLANLEYWIPFGRFAYNIALKIKKLK